MFVGYKKQLNEIGDADKMKDRIESTLNEFDAQFVYNENC